MLSLSCFALEDLLRSIAFIERDFEAPFSAPLTLHFLIRQRYLVVFVKLNFLTLQLAPSALLH